jgi:hypothetical protein
MRALSRTGPPTSCPPTVRLDLLLCYSASQMSMCSCIVRPAPSLLQRQPSPVVATRQSCTLFSRCPTCCCVASRLIPPHIHCSCPPQRMVLPLAARWIRCCQSCTWAVRVAGEPPYSGFPCISILRPRHACCIIMYQVQNRHHTNMPVFCLSSMETSSSMLKSFTLSCSGFFPNGLNGNIKVS